MSSDAKATICIVTPVHNGGEGFRRCLSALSALEPPPGEIVVVADGDIDGSGEWAEARGAKVIRTPTRGGPARARNLGARAAHDEVLFFVDADVLVPRDAVAQVAELFGREPYLTAIFGSYDDAPSETNFLSQYKNLLHHYVHQTAADDASTFWAGCGAIRRAAFLSVGGFDERYDRPSIEDIELGYRLKGLGHSIRLCKTLQCKHLKRWTAHSLLRTDFTQRALPWSELILRDRKLVNDLNLNYSSRASVALVYAFAGTLAAAVWRPEFLLASAGLVVALLVLNAALYRFFLRQRGLLFTLQAIPWHWLYFAYSGLAFAIAVVRHLLGRRRTAASKI
jgi:GT2 family glycosyltransferase